ncbi:DUF4234 domain-containing protein [Peptoniphilus sp. MSJ-1]|uniref:DUF4234 domain-containing protein n=1 Tax=Peptoniphilus ovalis TaxID=2841503 RepID=A0ABS6FFH4_9FIRM|nr:DUF4234 domain-containing protein [Peptoniphilus ovalis]MBU5668711.1 DUF4234 domain-containing protein [Peptoniphilus ovalis]
MRLFYSMMAILALPFIAARVVVMLLMIFTLFSIFRNWNKGHNKELMNAMIISTILLFIVSILSAIFSRISFGYFVKSADMFIPVLGLIITAIIYFMGNSNGARIYPMGYFDNLSNSEFLKRELSQSLDYLVSSIKKETRNFERSAFTENTDKYDPKYSGHGDYNHQNNYNPNYGYYGYRNLEPAPFRGYIKDDWSYLMYIILSIVTCNLYHYYFIYKAAQSVNIACAGDGEQTGGLLKFLGLGIITCGLYCLFWEYNIMNRMASNGPRYGRNIQDNGGTFLLWFLLGSWICGLGFIVSWYLLFKNLNLICTAYNLAHANNH